MRKSSQSKPPRMPASGQSSRAQKGDRTNSDSSRDSGQRTHRGWKGSHTGERTDSDSSRDSYKGRIQGGLDGREGWGRDEQVRYGRERKRRTGSKHTDERVEKANRDGWKTAAWEGWQGQDLMSTGLQKEARGRVISREDYPQPRGNVVSEERTVEHRGLAATWQGSIGRATHESKGLAATWEGSVQRPRLVRRDSSLDGRMRQQKRKEWGLQIRNRPSSLDRMPPKVNMGQHRTRSPNRGQHKESPIIREPLQSNGLTRGQQSVRRPHRVQKREQMSDWDQHRERGPIKGQHRERSPITVSHRERSPIRRQHRERCPIKGQRWERSPIREHHRERSPIRGQQRERSHARRQNQKRNEARALQHGSSPKKGQHKGSSNIPCKDIDLEEDVEKLFLDTKIEMVRIIVNCCLMILDDYVEKAFSRLSKEYMIEIQEW